MVAKEIPVGSIRIQAKDLKAVKKTKSGYALDKKFDSDNIKKIAKIYKEHKNFDLLVDSKDKKFLKGYLNKEKKAAGARVPYLYNNKKLNKAFSLFSPHLTLHEHTNNSHWDVIYQNPNGQYSYLYTMDKIDKSKKNKFHLVEEFDKVLPKLKKNLLKGIKNKEHLALSLYTLVKTYMRIGSEIYFKKNKHQGLITLQKNNVFIDKDNVIFSFLAKDGVPQTIELVFPEYYINNLKKRMKKLKSGTYVFCDEKENKLHEKDFHKAFKKYCSKEFYPHIVRSHYATKKVEEFLEQNKKPTKKEVIELYNEIAEKLGHKKFSKKKQEWQVSHTVTIAHYISPKLVTKIRKIVN